MRAPGRRVRSAALLAALVATAPLVWPAPAAASLTLEEILGYGFPSDLVASPDGRRLAWVVNERGRRSIWVATSTRWDARRVLEGTADDGQELSGLVWDREGRQLAWVRGGGANRAGELPNPLSDPRGVEQSVWLLDGAGKTRRLDEGAAPVFGPDGSWLIYRKKGEIWRADLADGATAALIRARGSFSDLSLSPTGDRVAFVSSRGSHSFVGVYSFDSATLRWVDPGLDRDHSPSWSPDGNRLAFVREPARLSSIVFAPRRESPLPWEIRLAELDETGTRWTSRRLWHAESGPGSVFHALVASRQLFWTGGDRVVFAWERSGWNQLWSVAVATGEVRDLQTGDFEVEYASQQGFGGTVFVSSNEGDIDRRHVWGLSPGAMRPEPLTRGAGIEQAPVPVRDGVAFLASDARITLHPEVLVAGRRRALGAAPSEAASLVVPKAVEIVAADGLRVHGQLFEPPPEAGPSPPSGRPAVVFFHGGSRRQMLLGWHYNEYYHRAYAFHQYLASRGFVVLSVNYRSGIGYGLDFREAERYGATGASELQDVLGAGLFLRALDGVDPARVGLWGGSYGGYLTALGLARASHLFAAGVDLHGVHDWNRAIANFVPSYDPTAVPEVARLAFESSPLSSVDSWRSPVLLVHGDDDRNVPFDESVRLATALRERGVEVEALVFPDEVHDILGWGHWLEALEAAARFLESHLSG